MVVVAAFRDRGEEVSAELSETLADLSRLEGVTRLALGNLSDDEVRRLHPRVDGRGGAARAGVDDRRADQRDSAAALRALARPALPPAESRCRTSGVRLATAVERAARLGADPRRRRGIAGRVSQPRRRDARAGGRGRARGSSSRLLADAAGLDQTALVASVEEAVAAGMLEELPDAEPACRFTHELVRRAIYDGIRRVRRPELHLRVGEALERTHAADPARCPARARPSLHARRSPRGRRAWRRRTTSAPPRPPLRPRPTTRRPRGSRARSSSGSPTHAQRAHVQAELGLLLFHTGRVGESEAILSASLDAATEPRGTRPRDARARAPDIRAAVVGSRGRLGRDRADRRGGDQDVRAAR